MKVRGKNVKRAEAILRSIIGFISIIFAFFIEGIFGVGSWIDRFGIYPYCDIPILTVKRIYAEGLQQRKGVND